MASESITEEIYDLITDDEDEDFNQAIGVTATQNVPRNYLLNTLNGTATKLGDQLASPSLVLPWLMAAIGAPAYLTGFLVPVRRSLALLPQLAISGQMRAHPVRKWFWVGGAIFYATFLLLMVPASLLFSSVVAGVAILVLLAFASLARGVGSVAFKDVVGKTIPPGRRGQLLAARATSGGVLAVAAGFVLRSYVNQNSSILPYLILVASAGGLWLIGALLIARIQEEPGETEGGRNPLQEALTGVNVLREVSGFRRFILARILLLSVKLATPFYVLYARQFIGGNAGNLGIFVIVTGVANVLSSPSWGRFADRSSRTVMILAGALGTASTLFILLVGVLPDSWHNVYVFGATLLLVGFAQAGIRLGRKTHLIDGAPENERPLYAAISNTIIGAMTLLGGALGVIAEAFSVRILLWVLAGFALAGVGVSLWMPEAENMVPSQA
jgi:predicted MFS family arabinose efflux permease